jgi:DNA-directed RNA polymerase subunit N (RpoN/RPB10)
VARSVVFVPYLVKTTTGYERAQQKYARVRPCKEKVRSFTESVLVDLGVEQFCTQKCFFHITSLLIEVYQLIFFRMISDTIKILFL